jgi:hypothetical protein
LIYDFLFKRIIKGLLMTRSLRTIGCGLLSAVLVFAGCRAYKKTAFSQGNEMAAEKITLKQANAQKVWEIFQQIDAIPRCSKNEKQIMDWLKGLAKSRNLACRSDDVDNVII